MIKNRVIVNGNYTYETDKEVKVGSIVVVPTPSWLRDAKGATWEGKVTSLESNYDGPCMKIIEVKKL